MIVNSVKVMILTIPSMFRPCHSHVSGPAPVLDQTEQRLLHVAWYELFFLLWQST